MIVHAITPYKVHLEKHKGETHIKWRGRSGSTEHKMFIHKRTLMHQPFNVGDWVRAGKDVGQISDIYGPADFQYTNWTGLLCHFIEVYFTDNEMGLYHPSQLKKVTH